MTRRCQGAARRTEAGEIKDLENHARLTTNLPIDHTGTNSIGNEGFLLEKDRKCISRILGVHKNLSNYKAVLHEKGINSVSGIRGKITFPLSDYKDLVFSASRLSRLVQCPYRFFLEYLLKLEEEDVSESDPFVWLGPLEWGNLIHGLMYSYYHSNYISKENNSSPSKEKLVETGVKELERFKKIIPPPSSYIFGSAERRLINELHQYAAKGFGIEEGFNPWAFEVPVGPPGNKDQTGLSCSAPVEADFNGEPIKLVGRIDRVDAGNHGAFILIDYKTGRVPDENKKSFDNGEYVQHAVYPAIFKKAFGGKFDIVKIDFIYYFCTTRGNFNQKRFEHNGKNAAGNFSRLVSDILCMIKKGKFPQNRNNCDYCPFKTLICPETAGEPDNVTRDYLKLLQG